MRQRFISDKKLPVPVLESPWFEYYLSLYGELDEWKRVEGLGSEFLTLYYKVREEMIRLIKASPSYQSLGTNAHGWTLRYKDSPTSSPYNMLRADGRTWYLSIDLRKANLQVLEFAEGENQDIDDYWREFVEKAVLGVVGEKNKGLIDWMVASKYIRQVIFGNCNPKTFIKEERLMVGEAAWLVGEKYGLGKPIMASTDEVIFEAGTLWNNEWSKGEDEKIIKETLGIQVRVEPFRLFAREYLNGTGHVIRAYLKTKPGGEVIIKDVPRQYYAQVYQDVYGIPVDSEDRDLVFYQEKDLAKFLTRLKRI